MKQSASQTRNKNPKPQHIEKAEQKDKQQQKKNELVIHHYNGAIRVRGKGFWVFLQ